MLSPQSGKLSLPDFSLGELTTATFDSFELVLIVFIFYLYLSIGGKLLPRVSLEKSPVQTMLYGGGVSLDCKVDVNDSNAVRVSTGKDMLQFDLLLLQFDQVSIYKKQ